MSTGYESTTYDLHDCTPDSSQRYLLTAVLRSSDASLEAWRAWCGEVDIEDVDSASFRLLPLIYLRLKTLDPTDQLLARLKVVYRHTWFKNQMLTNQSKHAADIFAKAGIDCMLLKGGALSIGYYQDAGARFMHDMDLMVRPTDYDRAMTLLVDSGWQIQGTSLRHMQVARRLGFAHGCSFKRKDAELDLHAQLSRFVWQDDAVIWATASTVEWGSSKVHVPSPTVALYHTCVHGVRWSYAPLTWIPDAMSILRKYDDPVDWELLLKLARQSRTVCQLQHALNYLAAEWSAPVPSRVLIALTEAPTSWVEQREYAVMAKIPNRSLKQLATRLWFRSCRYRKGGKEAQRPIPVSLVGWIAYLLLYKLGPRD
ncbi:MAG: hypothetical protein ACI9JM_001456 [Halioglobus sp.]|jgi:hypothetical protein